MRPWDTANTTGYQQVGTLNASTDTFTWRYKSLNNYWVLGRVAPASTGIYDWVFVQASCVGGPASGTRAATAS